MIYKSLEGKAQRQAAAYFEVGGEGGRESPEDFIRFLDRSNWDPTRVVRARGELNRMKMGTKQEWNTFFPAWANKLTESHGDNWPDETKITMLRGAVNQKLRSALASNHLIPSDNYFEWIRIVGQIALQHEELGKGFQHDQGSHKYSNEAQRVPYNNFDEHNSSEQANAWGSSGTERGFVGKHDSVGDTYMRGINMASVLRNSDGKPLRAKWKTIEQIAKLRSEGRCFRCELKGCNTRICRLLPARKPVSRGAQISNVTFEQLDPRIYDVEEHMDGEDIETKN